LIWLGDHFDMDAFRQTDLFVGTEFIALDVLKRTNAGAPKKHRGYPGRCPSGGLTAGRSF